MQPPQNPYSGSGFPGPNDPIPPGGYGGSTSPTGIPNGGPTISFDAIGQAWTVIKPFLGVYIGAILILAVVAGIGGGLQGALTPHGANGQQEFSPLPLIVGFFFGLINLFLGAGYLRMSINHLRTGSPNFSDLFSAGNAMLNLILAVILMYIAILIGMCLCIIPGLLIASTFLFVQPLIVDKGMGAIEAISTSYNALKSQVLMAFLFALVTGIVGALGVIACGVGVLVTAPIAGMAIVITYRNFFDNGSTQGFGGQSFPVAPIADPRF